MKRLVRALCLCAFCILSTSACARKSALPPSEGQVLSTSTASEIRAELSACNGAIRSMRSLLSVDAAVNDRTSAFRYALVFSKPGKLRVEAFPRGAVYTLSLLVVDEGRFTYLEPGQRIAARGEAGAAVLNRYLGVPLYPEDLMALITGCVPPRFFAGTWQAYEQPEAQTLILRANGLSVELDSESRLPRAMDLVSIFDDTTALRVQWEDYREIQGQLVPGQIEIFLPESESQMLLDFRSQELNGEYPQRLFSADIPAGYEVLTRPEMRR